jgi:hypothetical protein
MFSFVVCHIGGAVAQWKQNWPSAAQHLSQCSLIQIILILLWIMVLLTKPTAVKLSVIFIGNMCCFQPTLSMVFQIFQGL